MAATHQRKVIFEAVVAAPGHYSPEEIYAVVKRRIPSVSLATIYNNLRLFVEKGLLREVTPHSSTLRVDGNLESHHHLSACVARQCRIFQVTSLLVTSLTSNGWPGRRRVALI